MGFLLEKRPTLLIPHYKYRRLRTAVHRADSSRTHPLTAGSTLHPDNTQCHNNSQ